MPLTPDDVSRKKFTAVRLREGYDTVEVDAFLEEVEAELVRLNRENAELRTKLETAQVAGATPPAAEPAREATVTNPSTAAGERPAADQPVAEGAPTPTPGIETIRVSTTAEASAAATRLLELATRSADELMIDAQTQADTILASARSDAERLEQEARQRAQQLDVETNQRREQLFSSLDRDRSALVSEVESLRTFEREYRAELKDYFTKQLDALEHPLAHSERFGTASDSTGTRVAEVPYNGSTGG